MSKGDTFERRRLTVLKPYAGADLSIPDGSDHDRHLRLIFAACRLGFTWLVRNETSTTVPYIHRAHTEASPAKRGRFFA